MGESEVQCVYQTTGNHFLKYLWPRKSCLSNPVKQYGNLRKHERNLKIQVESSSIMLLVILESMMNDNSVKRRAKNIG